MTQHKTSRNAFGPVSIERLESRRLMSAVATAVLDPTNNKAFNLSVEGYEGAGTTFTWKLISSPSSAVATFPSQGLPQTKAVVDRSGSYTFAVTTSDGQTLTTTAVAIPQIITSLAPDWLTKSVPNYQSAVLEEWGLDQFGRSKRVFPKWSLAPGSIGSIVQLDSTTVVYQSPGNGLGYASIVSTVGSLTSYRTAVIGAPNEPAFKVDFAPSTSMGDNESMQYDPDWGATYGNIGIHVLGWNTDHTAQMVDRNKNGRQLIDTSVAMKSGAKWEYAVPNGLWTVTVGVGDSGASSTNTVRVEGVSLFAAQSLAANQFSTKTITVEVKDNRLTIDNGSAANLATKLTHISGLLASETPTPIPLNLPVKFDFTRSLNREVGGTIMDYGATYGDPAVQIPLKFGWNTDHTANAVDNGVLADDVLDTSISVRSGGKWEFLLPNGTYAVTVGLGSAKAASTNTVTLEGSTLVSGLALASGTLATRTMNVVVSDGKLTLGVASAADRATKLTHLIVSRVTPALTPATKINYQPASAPAVSGYLVDSGATYASRNGRTYGWSVSHTDAAFDRNKNSSQLLDTSIGVKAGAKWEMAVVNGTYNVKISVGDAGISSKNTVTVEGASLFNAVALAANVFSNKTIKVTVTDGKLTVGIGAAANLSTRLNFIEITPA